MPDSLPEAILRKTGVISTFADDNQALLEQLGVADVIAKKSLGPAVLGSEIRSLIKRIEDGRGRGDPRRGKPLRA